MAASEGVHLLDARAPEGLRLYAIGDVHGRADLLAQMHALIRRELEEAPPRDWRVIHLGDYVDRGPASCGVLDLVVEAGRADPRMMALGGNHDIGFLDFLADPMNGALFLNYGGVETARSYGVDLDLGSTARLVQGHRDLIAAVPDAHLSLLQTLEFSATFGDFFFCHAGIRPGIELERQVVDDLVWIRDPFLTYAGPHPKVIVHGHTMEAEPEILPNRVNVDTGAWRSGRLSALVVDGVEKRILVASA
jgi:serine/threonine protein phosphatase 1